MDTAKLKKFAIEARKELMSVIGAKMELVLQENSFARRDNPKAVKALDGLIGEIGREQAVEQVAYTWFNRFVALRFMDAHHYTPIGVVSPVEGQTQPEILAEAKAGYIDEKFVSAEVKQRIIGFLNGSISAPNPQEKIYRLLLVAYCNAYHEKLPFMFEHIRDYTELLLPDDLLSPVSVLTKTIETLDAETCKDVEVIGWLYQYYISEKKEQLDYELKKVKNRKVQKDDMAAKTQIFTPEWIVKYMVENSLGKLWLENHPNSELQAKLTYYLESAPQEPEVQKELIATKIPNLKPEDIKFLDPACGSGHILVKAFEVLFEIYKSQGWQENEIPQMILQHNLFGLDIDKRAAQLAQLALIMKAREYDRKIFEKVTEFNICPITDTNWLDFHIAEEILEHCSDKEKAGKQIKLLQKTFFDAKEYGSIIKVNGLDFEFWHSVIDYFDKEQPDSLYLPIIRGRLRYIIKQAQIMQQQYEVVVTNPPYLGGTYFDDKLSDFVKKNYVISKGDMFAVFMEVTSNFTKANCYNATINQHSWMFLSSYEELRAFISNQVIDTMVHLGTRAFEELDGEVVQTTTYVCRKQNIPEYIGKFVRLTDYADAKLKEQKYLQFNLKDIFICKQNGFHSIPGSPIAYWASDRVREIFADEKNLSYFMEPKCGLKTGITEKYIKSWSEIPFPDISFDSHSREQAKISHKKWFPVVNGGNYRKWSGNLNDVVFWFNDGYEIRNLYGENEKLKSRPQNMQYYFKQGLTWSALTSKSMSVRYAPKGTIISGAGYGLFNEKIDNLYILGLLNSRIIEYIISTISMTLNFEVGTLSTLPIKFNESILPQIDALVEENIAISKDDWDSFETSWDFEEHPLLRFKTNGNIKDSFKVWADYKEKQFNRLKANEEELNRLFIEIYGLQNEMTSDVEDKDITIRKADELREIKSLISYAVGCMFGRYSLNKKGLIYAGGDFDASVYTTFIPDADNAIPVLARNYFADDIVERFKAFIKTAFGENFYVENLSYIADVLGKKNSQSNEQVLRDYFIKDFYKDHVQIYQKRPIYWMFSSEKNAFNALVYLHRYNKDTVNIVLNEYLREYENKLSSQITACAAMIDKGDIRASKEKTALQASLNETEDYERNILFPLATERKEIDLDDGVKVNYLKFGKALRNIGLKEKA